MRGEGRVLILAGTAEARAVCAGCAGLDVLASLAGATRDPAPLGVPTRVGGWGSDAGFARDVAEVAAVLDATHPFAASVTARAVAACASAGVPYLRLTRPGWPREPGWRAYPDLAACAAAIPREARLFLALGARHARAFAEAGAYRLVRTLDPGAEGGMDGMGVVGGLPSPDIEAEAALMRGHAITDLVTRDSGGPRAKLDAAAALGIAVHVIDRPPRAGGEETHDIPRAIAFVRAHAASLPPHRDG